MFPTLWRVLSCPLPFNPLPLTHIKPLSGLYNHRSVLLALELYVKGIIQHIAFESGFFCSSFWLWTSLRLLHISVILFFLNLCVPLHKYITIYLCYFDGHLSYFPFLSNMWKLFLIWPFKLALLSFWPILIILKKTLFFGPTRCLRLILYLRCPDLESSFPFLSGAGGI